MGTITKFQTSFSRGEVDPLIMARFDLANYYSGAEKMRNYIPQPQGGARVRPGTKYIDSMPETLTRNTTVPTAPNGGTAANGNDNSESTYIITTVAMNATNPYVIAKYDLGAATLVAFVDIVNFQVDNALGVSATAFVVQYSTDDAAWTTLGDPIESVLNTNRSRRWRAGVTARYWRFAKTGATNMGATLPRIAEMTIWEESGTLSGVRFVPFTFSTTQSYLMAFSDRNLFVFKDGVFQLAVRTPYTSAQLPNITWTQNLDTMIICHEDVAPQKLVRQGDHDQWQMEALSFDYVPQYDFNDASSPTPVNDVHRIVVTGTATEGDSWFLDLDGFKTIDIIYSATTAVFAQRIKDAIQNLPNTGLTGVSCSHVSGQTWDITFSGESANNWPVLSAGVNFSSNSMYAVMTKTATGSPRSEAVWSSTRGWPRTALFYQARLYFGGSKSLPATLWASRVGAYFNFDTGTNLDDEGISVDILSDDVSAIIALVPSKNFLIFTSSSEYYIPQTSDSVITPNTISIRQSSHNGAEGSIPPISVGGYIFYLQREGKILWETGYNIGVENYESKNVSLLASHLLTSPVDMAYRPSTSTDSADWVGIVNTDGTMAMLVTLREQDVTAWSYIDTAAGADKFIAIGVDQFDMYVAVNRVNALTDNVVTIEKFDYDFLVDSGVAATSFPATTITGLDHIESRDVAVIVDGVIYGNDSIAAGSVTLPATAATDAQVGLSFSAQLKTLPLIVDYKSGSAASIKKRVHEVNLHLNNTSAITVDGKTVPFRRLDESLMDSPVVAFTGRKKISGRLGWTEEAQVDITNTLPAPCTVLGVELKVAT